MKVSSLNGFTTDYKRFFAGNYGYKTTFKGSLVNDYLAKEELASSDKSAEAVSNTYPTEEIKPQEAQKNKVENSFPQASKSKWLTKENMIIGGAGLALSGAIAAYAIIRGKGVQRVLNSTQEQLRNNQRIVNELRAQINKLTELPSDLKKAKELAIKKYQRMFNEATLNYDPTKVPLNYVIDVKDSLKSARKVFSLSEIRPFQLIQKESSEVIEPQNLKKILDNNGILKLSLPRTSEVKPAFSSKAFIEGQSIEDLGKTVNTDFRLDFGRRIKWSERKIARDIMQNFYDGHGNTLDGVGLVIKKLPNGEFSIKISGEGTYNYEDLKFLGSGVKEFDPNNAGGYGEGAKVVVANMLGRGYTKSVKYACSDWEFTFDASNGIIRRNLQKAQTPLNGNTLEFNTTNEKLVDSILDSINYFRHSKNPDFKNLHYDSPDFAFRFLEGESKGNLYLTQRFEFGENGAWGGHVDNLNLIFKRKPDENEYFSITGKILPGDRDRSYLSNYYITGLTRYFTNKMSDEELARTFLTTKTQWEKLSHEKESNALLGFMEGLIETMKSRRIKIDFGNERLVAKDATGCKDFVLDTLSDYGYKLCPSSFEEIGMPSASDVFHNLSIHKALIPNAEEIKKLKMLEEGIRIIKEDIDNALSKHAKQPVFKFMPDLKANKFISDINKSKFGSKHTFLDIEEFKEITKRYISEYGSIEKLSDEQFARYKAEIEQAATKLLRGNPDDKTLNILFNNVYYSGRNFDERTKEYLKTYKTLKLIKNEDVTKPRFIFDRKSEIAKDTLGEAIIKISPESREYLGHWVDREYLKNADFNTILATWLHEICHKSGGDGTTEFTYTLTDMLRVLLNTSTKSSNQNSRIELAALEEIYNGLNNSFVKAA